MSTRMRRKASYLFACVRFSSIALVSDLRRKRLQEQKGGKKHFVMAPTDLSPEPDRRPLRQAILSRVPSNTTVIGEIKAFLPLADGQDITDGEIELVNGTVSK